MSHSHPIQAPFLVPQISSVATIQERPGDLPGPGEPQAASRAGETITGGSVVDT